MIGYHYRRNTRNFHVTHVADQCSGTQRIMLDSPELIELGYLFTLTTKHITSRWVTFIGMEI